jgi:hypothetical protein
MDVLIGNRNISTGVILGDRKMRRDLMRGMGEDDARLSTIASSRAKDLALLERRAQNDGFQVEEEG